MRERLLGYIDYIDKKTSGELSAEQKEFIIKDLLIQIGFFQHERLIHLIVTVTFAIISIFTTLACTFVDTIFIFIFLIIMFIMLLFYVRHYFLLERGVQKLYTYYDKLIK